MAVVGSNSVVDEGVAAGLNADQSTNPPFGKQYKKGDWMVGIQASGNTFIDNAVAPYDCHLVSVEKEHGALVSKGEVIGWIEK